jgi:hypothetical protein
MSRLIVFRELIGFMVERRKLILLPVIIVLLLMSLFIGAAEVPVLTPFIYALF